MMFPKNQDTGKMRYHFPKNQNKNDVPQNWGENVISKKNDVSKNQDRTGPIMQIRAKTSFPKMTFPRIGTGRDRTRQQKSE